MIQDRTCRMCGRSFRGGPRAYYCPDCRVVRQREQAAKCKRNGPQRPLGSTDQCEKCGKDYIVVGGLQRFCPECAPQHKKEYDRITSKAFYHANAERIKPIKNERRRQGLIKCRECGKEFDAQGTRRKDCSDVCRRAYINRRWREKYYKPSRGG